MTDPPIILRAATIAVHLLLIGATNAPGQRVDSAQAQALAPGDSSAPPRLIHTESIQLSVMYAADYLANVSGGVRRGSTYLDNLDVHLSLDLDRLVGWRGATAFAYGLANQGGSPSELVGDLQTLSNFDAPDTWKLYEAWIEQEFSDGRASVRLGLYDLNSEFDVIDSGGLFLNSSHGIGPDFSQTGENGPSIFPTTSLAIRVRVSLAESVGLKVVALDAVSGNPDNHGGTHITLSREEGALLATEIELNAMGGKFAAGAFWYTATSASPYGGPPADDGPASRVNRGFYVLADVPVRLEQNDSEQGLSAYLRLGAADPWLNQTRMYAGAGLTYAGPFPRRDDDELGLAVAHARNGDPFMAAAAEEGRSVVRAETAIELTYSARVKEWFSVQPDLQYIINPGTRRTLSNALVAGLRVGITL